MFSSDADFQRADWPLLQNGAVNLFHRQEHLRDAEMALQALGYEIAKISCRDGPDAFRHQFSSLLRWEQQFGYGPWTGNLDALNDGLSGYPFGSTSRAALMVDGFHEIASADPGRAYAILDMIEGAARDHLLWGKTLIALIQTDDPEFQCAGIGGRGTNWNRKERFGEP
jgi:hypothetical protein